MGMLVVCVLALSVRVANADPVPEPTHAQMLEMTDLIVGGIVTDVRTHERGPSPAMQGIYTEIRVEVRWATEQASAGQTLTFWMPGGTVGRRRRVVVGYPRFQVGEHVGLYLATAGGVATLANAGWSKCAVNSDFQPACTFYRGLPGPRESLGAE